MQASSCIADALYELSLDEAMHILVGTRNEGGITASFLEDGLEPAPDRRRVLLRQDAGRAERLRPREAACDVVFEERAIEAEGNPEIERSGIGLRIEAAGPECHEW